MSSLKCLLIQDLFYWDICTKYYLSKTRPWDQLPRQKRSSFLSQLKKRRLRWGGTFDLVTGVSSNNIDHRSLQLSNEVCSRQCTVLWMDCGHFSGNWWRRIIVQLFCTAHLVNSCTCSTKYIIYFTANYLRNGYSESYLIVSYSTCFVYEHVLSYFGYGNSFLYIQSRQNA